MKKGYWMFSTKPVIIKPSEAEKKAINEYFEQLVKVFKKKCVKKNTNKKEDTFVIDVYTKWYQNNFYLCEKYKSKSIYRIHDEFETKVVRLTFVGKDRFDFSYMRHTQKWHLVADGISMKDCRDMILSTPNFQPL